MFIAKNTLYSYVVTRWKPRVQQVQDWMDSYWHKEEMIPVAKIEGLQALLTSLPSQTSINNLLAGLGPSVVNLSANGTFTIPAGKTIDLIRVESALAQTLALVDPAAGEDLLGPVEVTAGIVRTVGTNIPSGGTTRLLNINGVTSAVTIKFYLR